MILIDFFSQALVTVSAQFCEPVFEAEKSKTFVQEDAPSGFTRSPTRLNTEAAGDEVLGFQMVAPESLISSTISADEDCSAAVTTDDLSTLPNVDVCGPTTNVLSNQAAATKESMATHPSQVSH